MVWGLGVVTRGAKQRMLGSCIGQPFLHVMLKNSVLPAVLRGLPEVKGWYDGTTKGGGRLGLRGLINLDCLKG